MDYFAEKRRFAAVVSGLKWGYRKSKKAEGRTKLITLEFLVRITPEIKSAMPSEFGRVMSYGAAGDGEYLVSKVSVSREIIIALRVYHPSGLGPRAVPILQIGLDGGPLDYASLKVRELVQGDDAWMLKIQCRCPYTKELWEWLGDRGWLEADCVLETEPFQDPLFRTGDNDGEQEGEESVEDDEQGSLLDDPPAPAEPEKPVEPEKPTEPEKPVEPEKPKARKKAAKVAPPKEPEPQPEEEPELPPRSEHEFPEPEPERDDPEPEPESDEPAEEDEDDGMGLPWQTESE